MQLQKATRKQVKLKLGLSAVAGGGKTKGALLLAKGLCGNWEKIAVIDTENNSASLYSDMGPFNTLELTADYTPEKYIQAIKACEDAGMEVIIIDSITHEWDGKGGIIDISNSMTGNSFTNWAKITPRHQAFIDAILQSKCHVITTVRRKQDYEMNKDSNGKTTVTKAGLKEVTREGFEYELTLNFNLDERHNCTASKDRTGLFMDKPAFIITEDTGKLIKQWCEQGVDVDGVRKEELASAIAGLALAETKQDLVDFKKTLPAYIVEDASFLTAGKERLNVIMASAPKK
jgi:hypothetical protein